MEIKIQQSSREDKKLKNYWHWSLWIDASDEVMDSINYVEYVLHSTFPDRIRKKTSKKNKFKLSTKGWGEFRIYVKVYLKEKEDPLVLSHDLILFSKPEKDDEQAIEKVFISSSFSNQEEVNDVIKDLTDLNVDAKSQESLNAGLNWTDEINKSISDSNAYVLITNKDLTRQQHYELDTAKKANKKIIIVSDEKEDFKEIDGDYQVIKGKDNLAKKINSTLKDQELGDL